MSNSVTVCSLLSAFHTCFDEIKQTISTFDYANASSLSYSNIINLNYSIFLIIVLISCFFILILFRFLLIIPLPSINSDKVSLDIYLLSEKSILLMKHHANENEFQSDDFIIEIYLLEL